LLKLGFEVGKTTVAKYMNRTGKPFSQGWRTFLRNHAEDIAAMGSFVVPTNSFKLLYGLVMMSHDRRKLLHLSGTTHRTAEWIARQLTEAVGWNHAPRYVIRDMDGTNGEVFKRRLRTMIIRDHPTAPRSRWQNGCWERLIGSIRRERLDHVLILHERHLRHVLRSCTHYYNGTRTHLSLSKDPPA
jgi:hypothetical protein